MKTIKYLAVAAAMSLSAPIFAQEAPAAPDPVSVERSGRIAIDGRNVSYTVRAAETYLENDDGEPTASIFSITYLRDGVSDPASRPVYFVFNGGPGSASLWLHLGVFGPKRLALPSDARDDGAAPYPLIDNPHSPLDVADLVFIDPVGTGWSRELGEGDPADHWGLEQDARSLGRFIRLWLTKNGRWNSPKYLAGESYGTTRAAALVRELQNGWTDVSLNGVVLVSAVLNFQNSRFTPGNDQYHIAYLPTMAATAWHHGKVDTSRWGGDLEAFLDDARTFAIESYAPALLKGATLPAAERARMISELAARTGLSEDFIDQSNLRLSAPRFWKELLRDQRLTVGRLDSRFTGVDYDAAGENIDADPSAYGIHGGYTAAIHDYLTRELGVPILRDYDVIDTDTFVGWDWTQSDLGRSPAFVNVAPWLGRGMRENDDLKVLLMSGYYDFATPFFGAELALMRNGVPWDRVEREYYEAGHMMYIHEPSLESMATSLRDFVRP